VVVLSCPKPSFYLSKLANEGKPSHLRGIPLEQAHEIRINKTVIELQEKLTIEL